MGDILVVGDIYLGDRSIEEIAEKEAADVLFGDFLSLIGESSLAISNLESPITETTSTITKTGPFLKSSLRSLGVLKQAGFNLLTLANHHIMDYGEEGLLSTISECEKQDINVVGVGASLSAARQPFRVALGEKTVSIINIAENEFSTVGSKPYGANPMDPIENYKDILKAKRDSDVVIVIVHGGREHYQLPSPNFQKTLRFYVDCGADAVLAHHTHCVSGYEVYNECPIFYGLGNFLFNNFPNQDRPLWNEGLGVRLFFKENERLDFELIPFEQCKESNLGVHVLKDGKKKALLEKITELNTIITKEELLLTHWQDYVKSQGRAYRKKLFIKNKWLRKFVNRRLLPLKFFENEKYQTEVINLIKCETHREILLDSLE